VATLSLADRLDEGWLPVEREEVWLRHVPYKFCPKLKTLYTTVLSLDV
jgi:hypothetical protein